MVALIKENKKIQRTISGILVLVILVVIFNFSNQNGEDSEGTSKQISNKVIEILRLDNGLNEEEKDDLTGKVDHIIRKLAHFSIYTLLGFSLISFLDTINIRDKKRIVITIVFGLLYAISDEFHQMFISGRNPSSLDVMIDTLGVIFGVCIFLLLRKILHSAFH